jgi:hypothetical protein
MKRNRGRTAVGVTILSVGSALSNLDKTEALQNSGDLPRL